MKQNGVRSSFTNASSITGARRVGQVRGGTTLICHSITNVAAHAKPRERRPTNSLWKDLPFALARELNTGGGPARCGIYLFWGFNVLLPDSSA
jgi:hypothetical protein